MIQFFKYKLKFQLLNFVVSNTVISFSNLFSFDDYKIQKLVVSPVPQPASLHSNISPYYKLIPGYDLLSPSYHTYITLKIKLILQ